MGLFTITCMCIGTIIGAGIFGSLPRSVNFVGPAIALVFVIAGIEVVFRYTPSVIVSSAIPAPAGFYMQLSRLVSPYLGVLQFMQVLFSIFSQAALATIFASYLNMVVNIDTTVAGIGVLLLFGILGYFGTQTGAKVQNWMVVLLIIALLTYIGMGLPNIKPEYFTFSKAISLEGIPITSFGAALGLSAGALNGGWVGVTYADKMINPHRNIFMAFIISTCIAGALYALMGIVTCGVAAPDQRTTLGAVAQLYMSTTVWYFFIISGALMAIATTINGSIIFSLKNLGVIATDKVLPEVFARKNAHDISVACLLVVVLSDIFVVSFKLPVSTLISVQSALAMILAMAQFIPVIILPKRYPNCYKNARFKLPMPVVYVMIIISSCFCIYEIYSMIVNSEIEVWIGVVLTIALGYAYFIKRKSYLASRSVDLLAIMSEPYKPWEEKEMELAGK